MKPRRTPFSNCVLRLKDGNEDQDLWAIRSHDPGNGQVFTSVWQFTDEERERIAKGENIALHVWAAGHPPVALAVTDATLGRGVSDVI